MTMVSSMGVALNGLVSDFFSAIPGIFAAIIVLIIGYIVAAILDWIIVKILDKEDLTSL